MAFHRIPGPVFAWSGPGAPVDPGWGVDSPTDPGYGRPGWSPVDPGYGRPDWSGRPDNSLPWAPGRPGNALPSLPGIWPPPGEPNFPRPLPPLEVAPPIYIEEPETKPLPPEGVYPPLPPTAGFPSGKVAILVWVVGVGYRWLVVDTSTVAQPK